MENIKTFGFYLNGEKLLKTVKCSSLEAAKKKLNFSFPVNFNICIIEHKITFSLASWFTNCSLNTVKHPIYGGHQVTPAQLVRAGNRYRAALWAEIKKYIASGDISGEIILKYQS